MNPRRGYSILEVLIAFAVMSMTLAVLLPGQTMLLGRAATAADRALAHDYALSRLEQARVFGTSAGSDTYRDWQIHVDSSGAEGQRRVTVTVTNTAGRQLAEVSRAFAVRDAE